MATMGPARGKRRPQYATGVFLSRLTPWGVVVQSWPKKRPKTPTAQQQFTRDRLTATQTIIKQLSTRETQPEREAIAAVNRENRGLRGSASIRLEDWITIRLLGRNWIIDLPDGTRLVPITARAWASDILDWLEPRVGSVLTRTNTAWLPAVPCAAGRVLTYVTDGPIPECCPPASKAPQSEGVP